MVDMVFLLLVSWLKSRPTFQDLVVLLPSGIWCSPSPTGHWDKQPKQDGSTEPKFLHQSQPRYPHRQDCHDATALHHRGSSDIHRMDSTGFLLSHPTAWGETPAFTSHPRGSKGLKTSCLDWANRSSMSLITTGSISPPLWWKCGRTRKDLRSAEPHGSQSLPRGLHVTSTIFNERLLTVRIWDEFWGPPISEFHYETRQLFNLSMGPSVVNGHVYRPVPQEHASELGHSPNVRLSQSLPQNTSENGGSTMILPKRLDFQWLQGEVCHKVKTGSMGTSWCSNQELWALYI